MSDKRGLGWLSRDANVEGARAHQRLSHAWRQAIMNGSQRDREQIHAAGRVEKGFGATPGKMQDADLACHCFQCGWRQAGCRDRPIDHGGLYVEAMSPKLTGEIAGSLFTREVE